MAESQRSVSAEAAAFRILGRLDIYEDDLQVLAQGLCPETQLKLAAQIATLRTEATCLPQLIVPWVEFLISHERLLQSFAIAVSTSEPLDEIERHIELVLNLRGECLELLTGKRQLSRTWAAVARTETVYETCPVHRRFAAADR